tara:strand:- start:67 stop:231 length:165 start_codon:yes stop_codon:yes gene_type:complete
MINVDNCSICDAELETESGDIRGNFGITAVGFCIMCFSSILDMAKFHLGIQEEY